MASAATQATEVVPALVLALMVAVARTGAVQLSVAVDLTALALDMATKARTAVAAMAVALPANRAAALSVAWEAAVATLDPSIRLVMADMPLGYPRRSVAHRDAVASTSSRNFNSSLLRAGLHTARRFLLMARATGTDSRGRDATRGVVMCLDCKSSINESVLNTNAEFLRFLSHSIAQRDINMIISSVTLVTLLYLRSNGTDRVFGLGLHANDPGYLQCTVKREWTFAWTFARARHVRRHIISRIVGCSQPRSTVANQDHGHRL